MKIKLSKINNQDYEYGESNRQITFKYFIIAYAYFNFIKTKILSNLVYILNYIKLWYIYLKKEEKTSCVLSLRIVLSLVFILQEYLYMYSKSLQMLKWHEFHVWVNYPAQYPRHMEQRIQFTRSKLGAAHRFRISFACITRVTGYCQSRI